MKVTVLFFASIKEELGKDREEIELPAGVSTVDGLRHHLRLRGGAYEQALAEKKLVRAAINHDMVPQSAGLKSGDEVAFFPPVTGG